MKTSTQLAIVAMVCAAILLGMGFVGRADQPAAVPTRLAVIDMVRVFNNYQKTLDQQQQLKRQGERIRDEEQKRKRAIEKAKLDMDAFKPGTPEYNQASEKVLKMSVELRAFQELMLQKIANNQKLWTEAIYKEITDAVATYAKSHGLSVVLYLDEFDIKSNTTKELLEKIRQKKVIYHDSRLDISQDILNMLNEQYRRSKAGGS